MNIIKRVGKKNLLLGGVVGGCLLAMSVSLAAQTTNAVINPVEETKPVTINEAIVPKVATPSVEKLATPNPVLQPSVPTPQISTLNRVPTPAPVLVKKRPVYSYVTSVRDGFNYPFYTLNKYPNLNISGFHETKFATRDFNPKTATDSRLITIQNDPFYAKLPREVLPGSPSLFFTYKFNIDGNLDKDLSVHYDIEQDPDLPGKYDIKINYKTSKLTFYHFDVKLVDGELISIRKALNGAMFQSYTDDWETTIAFGKLRSQPNKFSAYGNGTKVINVGVGSILEDSLQVWVNNVPQTRGKDFSIDYYKGEITFTTTKTQTDYIVVVYEFTNKIEDFIPSLSRKNFVGAQFLWRAKQDAREVLQVKSMQEETLKAKDATPNAEYFTKFKPIILSSEIVKRNGRALRRNMDYFIKPQRGRITLPDRLIQTPSDILTISYDYNDTEAISDQMIAKDSPGPYTLSRHNVVDGSLTLSLDDVALKETQDYIVDYEAGKLMFNYPLNYGKILSVQYTAIKSSVEVPTKNTAPLSLGVTYASEYVPPQQADPVTKVASESATVTAGMKLITRFTPLVATDMKITINGVSLAPGSFSITDAYRGVVTISSLPPGMTAPVTAVISYGYTKSFKTTRYFQLKQLNGNKTYTNPYDFELQDLPVKYRGVQEIQMGQVKLSSGNEYVISYGDGGQSVTIRFLTQSENRGSILTTAPTPADVLTLIYDYTPQNQQQQGVLSQQMVGVTATNRWDNNWSSHAEVLVSDHNFSKTEDTMSKDLSGTGVSGDTYDFLKPNLVENSEAVYLINEQKIVRRINRDSDYVINYALGRVRLLHDTPGRTDTVRLTARFFTNDATTAGSHKTKMATKWSSQYKNTDLTVNGDFKFIDKEFLPIGDFLETKGTTVFGGNADWHWNPKSKITADFHHRDTFAKSGSGKNEPLYLHNDELTLGTKLDDVIDTISTEHTFHVLTEVQDPDPSTTASRNIHEVDNQTFDYAGRWTYTLDNSLTNYTLGFSQKTTDYLDRYSRSVISTQRNRIDNSSAFAKLWGVGSLKVGPYVELSRDQVDQITTSKNGTESVGRTYTARSSYGTTATSDPLPNLNLALTYGATEILSKAETRPTENLQRLINALYEANYRPASWLSTKLSIAHSEDESPLSNQKGKFEDERKYQINQLNARGVWNDFGLKDSAWWIWPVRDTTLSGSRSELARRENNFLRQYDSIGNNYSIANIEFIPGLTLGAYNYSDFDSFNLINEPNVISSFNTTSLKMLSRTISAGYKPQIPVLNLFRYGLTLEDRFNQTFSKQEAKRVTINSSTINDQTPFFKRDQTLNFAPGKVFLTLPFLPALSLGEFESNAGEGIKIQTNSQETSYYRVTNPEAITSRNILQDNLFSKYYSADAKYTPFTIFSLATAARKQNDIFNRNKISSQKGTAYLDTRDFSLTSTLAPFTWFKIVGTSVFKRVEQYESSQINNSLESLDQDYLSNNFVDKLKDYLLKNEATHKAEFTWFPWSFISFNGNGGFYKLDQIFADKVAKLEDQITQKLVGAGTTYYPFTGFSAAYNYTLKFSNQRSTNLDSQGYEGVVSVKYTPIKIPNFEVSFIYDRIDTWGRDLNTLDRTSNEQGSGTTIKANIVERADTVETAVLKIDINIPFGKSSAILDRIVITGEGYLKKIADGLDSQKKDKRSYELSGLILKGTMMF